MHNTPPPNDPDYPECSGDPNCCPENEGRGCCELHAKHPSAEQSDESSTQDTAYMLGRFLAAALAPSPQPKTAPPVSNWIVRVCPERDVDCGDFERAWCPSCPKRGPQHPAAPSPQPEQSGCGHPASLLLRSAESGEPLYCEACDDKSGRRDAEQMEQEWQKRALAAEAKLAAQADDFLKAHALNELQELGYTVEGDTLTPPEHLHKLIEAAGHPLAAKASSAAPQVVQGEVERLRALTDAGWLPMETAPKDGAAVLLLVKDGEHPLQDDNPSVSIGSFGVEGGPGQDPTWNFAGWCWHQDCYCRGTGEPVGWLPLPSVLAASPQASPTVETNSLGAGGGA